MVQRLRTLILVLAALAVAASALAGPGYPLRFRDASGREVVLRAPPERVVCVVPSVTEMIVKLGAADRLGAVTWHDTYPPEAAQKPVVGGFLSPSAAAVRAARPDLVILSPMHRALREALADQGCPLVELGPRTLGEARQTLALLGRVFGKEAEAERLIAENEAYFRAVEARVGGIPPERRLRVMRFMGRDRVMTPGDGSFQNEIIRRAGGVPPRLGKAGAVVPVTLEEWQAFDPQVVYGCGMDREPLERLLHRPGWRDVEAVREGRIRFFPCTLTCRAATNTGYFTAWLASALYPERFSPGAPGLAPDAVVSERALDLRLGYVARARVVESRILDQVHRTLVVDLAEPMAVVSTLEGPRTGITTVGNHGLPPPSWHLGLEDMRRLALGVLGLDPETTALLFTGADLANLSVQRRSFRDITVVALVTAGVRSNAVRTSRDEGRYYEPGTINTVLLTNTRLSARAMTRAVVTATEAKTAALQDLDVRSTYRPRQWQATGTGTDNVIVVEGRGVAIDNAGGHTRMGQLIAEAVYAGVREAVLRQNALAPGRSVLVRLHERRISPYGLVRTLGTGDPAGPRERLSALEQLLLTPRYAGFVEGALALADAADRGLVTDTAWFEDRCRAVASEIAGRPVPRLEPLADDPDLPPVLRSALDALLTGIRLREAGPFGAGRRER